MSVRRARVSLPNSDLWLSTVAIALRGMACRFLEAIRSLGLKIVLAMAGLAMAAWRSRPAREGGTEDTPVLRQSHMAGNRTQRSRFGGLQTAPTAPGQHS